MFTDKMFTEKMFTTKCSQTKCSQTKCSRQNVHRQNVHDSYSTFSSISSRFLFNIFINFIPLLIILFNIFINFIPLLIQHYHRDRMPTIHVVLTKKRDKTDENVN